MPTPPRVPLADERGCDSPHVVFRAFAAETIMLNLQTGTYHGLNPTAGRMLETLQQHAVITDAAAIVAEHYDADAESVQVGHARAVLRADRTRAAGVRPDE